MPLPSVSSVDRSVNRLIISPRTVELPAEIWRPLASPALLPSNWISSVPLKPVVLLLGAAPGWLYPSMTTGSEIGGSGVSGCIVCTPLPRMQKLIVLVSGLRLALRIACRSDPSPLSLVLTTVNWSATQTSAENSDVSVGASGVLEFWSVSSSLVAVALMISPPASGLGGEKLIVASPLASVVTVVKERTGSTSVCPSPCRLGSATVLLKNSIRKLLLGVLLNVPVIVVTPAVVTADVSAGKFCRLLAPVSQSGCPAGHGVGFAAGGSLGVTPKA